MRVPDQIRKAVLFVGKVTPKRKKYGGTAYIVTVPEGRGTVANAKDGSVAETVRYPSAFMVTARHVAEELEGCDFYIRANKRDGSIAEIAAASDTQWWYHPTEKQYVDAAVTMFSPTELPELDFEPVPIDMFADERVIAEHNLGIGDEIFITGLFTKVTETTRNMPIVRTGTVAMIPGEKIPFGKNLIEAYLVEARSIGGLSGSPVFVRETLKIPVHGAKGGPIDAGEIWMINGEPITPISWLGEMHGLGNFYFFGSIIGHWDLPVGFTVTEAEAVNMGISLVVPAHKIREVILQSEIVKRMAKMSEEV